MKIDPKRLRLYAVTDRAWTHDAEGLLRQVAAAVWGRSSYHSILSVKKTADIPRTVVRGCAPHDFPTLA